MPFWKKDFPMRFEIKTDCLVGDQKGLENWKLRPAKMIILKQKWQFF